MYIKVKRILDLIGAIILLILALPCMLISAMLIKLEDPKGPILFIQDRPGKDEKIFQIYKFRTMKVQAIDQEGNTLSDMQRMTHIGKWLRKLSLDELPQCLNIIKGDMSFIGPRPLLVQYLEHYNEEQRRRHHVRPGISGWAQVNGRNAISWEEKFQLDVWYVDHISLWTDLQILYRTIWNVAKRKDINSNVKNTMPFFEGECKERADDKYIIY